MKSDAERQRDRISCIVSCVGVIVLIALFAILLHQGPEQPDMDSMKCPNCGYEIRYNGDDIPPGADFEIYCDKCESFVMMSKSE